MENSLMSEKRQFRKLLEEYGLIELAGSEEDALSWLEGEVIKLTYSLSKRQRFLELLRQAKETLKREGEQQQDVRLSRELPKCEKGEKPNPHTGRKFRRLEIVPQ